MNKNENEEEEALSKSNKNRDDDKSANKSETKKSKKKKNKKKKGKKDKEENSDSEEEKVIKEEVKKHKQISSDQFIINQRFYLIKMLGSGSFGEIHLSFDSQEKKLNAIKFVEKKLKF